MPSGEASIASTLPLVKVGRKVVSTWPVLQLYAATVGWAMVAPLLGCRIEVNVPAT